ncbi:MAG: hypothetical protein ACD_58C00195G0002, partial [uncultured bacterium]
MKLTALSPTGLSKYLVGDNFKLELTVEHDDPVDFQLHTNLNREQQVIDLHPQNHSPHVFSLKLKLEKSGFFTYHLRYRLHASKDWH